MVNRMTRTSVFIVSFTVLSAALFSSASASDIKCLKCHAKLTVGVSVHKALNMGCTSCHAGIEAGTVPHKKTNTLPAGVSQNQPDLCFGCHDKNMFVRKDVHPALSMGCTTCHNPHSSQNPKLLTSSVPSLCFSCHDKAAFTRQNVHPPVASGACTICHSPHSSDEMALLLKKPLEVCLQCHPDTPHGSHITSSPTGTGPQDPKRLGKPFYCGTCHDPHSTNSPLLFRFNAKSMQELCVNCHAMN